MSEALEKVSGVEYLPIFPLPLVLLPNELLPLHIFEPKYRQMLKDIELKKNVFGVSLFEPANDFENHPVPGTVGCVAEVREVQPMPDERSNIVTTGLVRYRLLEYVDVGAPYLTAEIEFFEDEDSESGDLTSAADEVYELFNRIARAAFKLSGNRGKLPEIPQADPEPLSFLVTAAFNLDNELKYQLLELTSTLKRLEKLKSILEQSVGQMEDSADIQKLASTNGHSKKKLDL